MAVTGVRLPGSSSRQKAPNKEMVAGIAGGLVIDYALFDEKETR